ncbi:pseudouridine synthase [Hymenobacter latericus]|uniref:pseudouridine synthase n=1 Tax=Hymenobacter sp. YIM 151858-1 TaxID=2987688 RepID=UPI002225BEC2|nr:pseudouridine synthase [Hymenobacter sp. YIM 151858-1]UYZ60976.1 pseudouridine synthase [Hymenobacter sp. YIM 151858-1]
MRYILVNKPYEVLPQFTDEAGRATLKQFVAVPDVYPVGRLDYDSEGLMLLTDDKQMQFRLAEPRYKVPKTYWVQVEGIPTDEALEQLRRGVQIKDGFTSPAEARLLPEAPAQVWERSKPVRFRANIPTSWIELTISEGMNRQVRKMTAAVGFPTLRLIRTGIATLTLNKLAPGQWRELTATEIQALKQLTAANLPGETAPARKKPTERYDPNFEQKIAARKAAQANKAAAGKFGPARGPKSQKSGGRPADGLGTGRGSRPANAAPRGGKPAGGSSAPRSGGKPSGTGPARSGNGRPASPGRGTRGSR